jgi:hypothetical protein
MAAKTLYGVVHGKTIELDEDPGITDGQAVEVELKMIEIRRPASSAMTEGLAKVYAILSERYASGQTDTAARHDEHQP